MLAEFQRRWIGLAPSAARRRAARRLRAIAVSLVLFGCDGLRTPSAPVTVEPIDPAIARAASDPADLLSHEFEPAAVDGELRITPDMPEADRHLSGGWSIPALWDDGGRRVPRRWSVGPSSRIRFDLERVSPLRLSLRALAFQPPGGRLQHVAVWVNEQFLTSFALEGVETTYQFALPAGALRSGENVVRFRYLWTEEPVRVIPGSLDQRDLAMSVAEIVIRREEGVDAPAPALVSATLPDPQRRVRALLQPGSCATSVLVWPPSGSQLEVGWLRLRDADAEATKRVPVRYRVVLEWDHGQRVLVEGEEKRIERPQSARLPLPPEATPPLRLRFEVASDDPASRWLWLEPRISDAAPPEASESAVAPPPPSVASAPLPRVPPGAPVVIVVLDAAQRSRIGVYGHEADLTPHIDLLSRSSLVFDGAYAPASYTLASTASLFTSLAPSEHRVLADGDRLDTSRPTLATVLRANGYATAAFSGNPYVSTATNVTQGFETVVELFRDKAPGQVALGEEFVEPFRAWVEQQRGRPFFAYVHLIQPHEPYNASPREWYARWTDPNYAGPFDGSQEQMGQIYNGALYPSAADRAQIRGFYDGNLAYADKVVGDLVRTLGENAVFDGAIVIVTADHGESLGEHGIYGHSTSVDREQIAIPLIVHLPAGVVSPGRVSRLVSSIDVMPSVLALLGIAPPPGLEGRNWFDGAPANRDGWPRSIATIANGESGTVGVLVPGLKYSFDQANGRERLTALPDEEDGPNLRWERPVTFAYLAAEAARLTRTPAHAAPPHSGALDPDVGEALRALGYAR